MLRIHHIFGRRCKLPLVLLALAGITSALAQTPANTELDAQELIRQQERERVLRQQQEPTPDVRLERPALTEVERLPAQESPCFPIHEIRLEGDGAERFRWALAAANPATDPAIGRCLGTEGINRVMKRIQNTIVNKGFVTTRVLAQSQDLRPGTLTLTLIPGRLRAIRLAEGTNGRARTWNAVPARSGDLLNLRDIEQGLENFKRVPTAEADMEILPAEGAGTIPGESDLLIRYQQGFPLRVTLTADDAGSKATGKRQGGITISYDNALTLNDIFYVNWNQSLTSEPGTNGTHNHTIHYSIPFGYWLLGITTSNSSYYQTVAGANQNYIYRGKSSNNEIRLSRLVYRDASRKTTVWGRGWTRRSNNFIDNTEVEVQRRRMAGWEMGLGHREFLGKATLDGNLAYRRGTGAMRSLPAPEENFGEGTSRPHLMVADAQLNLPFSLGRQSFRYLGTWRAQWNDSPLVPQDRFSIGGRYTVRGYDGETVLSAERGWLVRNDLGLLFSGQELYLGIDYGEVSGQSARNLVGNTLGGAVIGLRGAYRGFGYDFFVGQPTKHPDRFKTSGTTAGFSVNFQF